MHTLNTRGLTVFALTLLAAAALVTGTAGSAAARPGPVETRDAAAPSREFKALERGTRGEAVRVAQRLLTYHGYPAVPDGVFGPVTQRRAREFQSDRGLPSFGAIDVETWEWLVIEVGRGDRGEPVRIAQWLLRRAGQPIAVDGVFGPRTEAATRAFRGSVNLRPTGVVDIDTWRALIGRL